MAPALTFRDRRGTVAAAVTAVVLAGGGATAIAAGLQHSGGPPQPARASAPAAPTTTTPAAGEQPPAAVNAPVGTPLHIKTLLRSRPVALSVPSIGVQSTSFVDLGTEADGSLQVPRDFGQPGWFAAGPAPGQLGPAVIAGHVDSKNGPGIFYRLGALRSGAQVLVTRADGSSARFVVDKVVSYPKNRFPTVAVYGDTTHRAELRLITCGGSFDEKTGHYRNNVVAYAHLL